MEENLQKSEWKTARPLAESEVAIIVGRLQGAHEPLSKQLDQLRAELAELRVELARIDKQTFMVGLKAGMITSFVAAAITILAAAAGALLIRWLVTRAALPVPPGS